MPRDMSPRVWPSISSRRTPPGMRRTVADVAPPPARSTMPEQIGRYRIKGRLGRGAMGVVYSAIDEMTDRPVALKVLMADLESDPETRERFYREAQAAARLLHPNVITVYNAGEDLGRS